MLNPRPEEIELYDRIIQEWLVSANMEVDDEVHAEDGPSTTLETETPSIEEAGPSTTPEVGPSTTPLLAKLIQKVDKLEVDI